MPNNPGMTNLNVRPMTVALMRKVKAAAALKGLTMREWVIEALEEKLRRKK
jgi:hypothetical protein